MSAHKLTPRVSPKLRVTAKLIQALNLLRLTTPVLKEYIHKSISENPLLQPTDIENLRSTIKSLISAGRDGIGKTHLTGADEIRGYAENLKSDTASLHDHLLHQLKTSFLNDNELTIGEEIIECLDNNGYMTSSLAELSQKSNMPAQMVEKVINIIQTFDPPGVGARSLQECLLIQLRINSLEHSLAYIIVKSFFKELSRKKLGAIAKKTSASIDKVKESLKIIASLNPKPGAAFNSDKNITVIPDVIIIKRGDVLKIRLNEKELPSLNINQNYLKLLHDQNASQEVKQFITERLKNALWLTKAMEERRANILKVMNTIVKIQKQAILKNLSHIKPLTLAEVAKISGLHHSTVSRIVANKYASTPQGTVKIRDLFSGKYRLSNGSIISSKNILFKIQRIIVRGNKKTPLTDKAIADILQKDGIQISRRAIAKYRKKLNIPSSFFRISD
jgi:RNA polymerase sigma-54 factor